MPRVQGECRICSVKIRELRQTVENPFQDYPRVHEHGPRQAATLVCKTCSAGGSRKVVDRWAAFVDGALSDAGDDDNDGDSTTEDVDEDQHGDAKDKDDKKAPVHERAVAAMARIVRAVPELTGKAERLRDRVALLLLQYSDTRRPIFELMGRGNVRTRTQSAAIQHRAEVLLGSAIALSGDRAVDNTEQPPPSANRIRHGEYFPAGALSTPRDRGSAKMDRRAAARVPNF